MLLLIVAALFLAQCHIAVCIVDITALPLWPPPSANVQTFPSKDVDKHIGNVDSLLGVEQAKPASSLLVTFDDDDDDDDDDEDDDEDVKMQSDNEGRQMPDR